MENNTKNNKKSKKNSLSLGAAFKASLATLLFGFFSLILLLGSFVGIGFGIKNNHFSPAKKNSYTLEVQTEISSEYGDLTQRELNNFIYKQLEFYGFFNVDVATIGDDQLLIEIPLLNLNDIENQDAPFSFSDQKQIITFSSLLAGALFYHGPVEVKTIDGQDIFVYDNDGMVAFNDGTNGTPGLVMPEEEPTTASMYVGDEDNSVPAQVFNHAYVDYNNGKPFLQLQPVDNNVYGEIEEAIEALIATNKPEAMAATFWMGYDIYERLVKEYDPEGYEAAGEDLYTYAHMTNDPEEPAGTEVRLSAKPFLLLDTQFTFTTELKPYNKVNGNHVVNVYPKTTSLSPQSANLIAARINYASSRTVLTPVSSQLVLNDESALALKVIGYLFLAFVVLSFIFMWWYLGLLGFINNSFLAVILLILLSIFSAAAIPLSIFTLIGIFVGYLIGMAISIEAINLFKFNTDKNASSWTKMKHNWSKLVKTYSLPLIIMAFFLGVLGFFSPHFIGLFCYFLLTILAAYFIYILLLLPLIYFILDRGLEFSQIMTHEFKWSPIVGVKKTFTFNSKKIDGLSTYFGKKKINFVFSICLILLTAFVGISLFVVLSNHSVVNNNYDYRNYYRYNVVWSVETQSKIPDHENATNNGSSDTEDPYQQQMMIDNLNSEEISSIVEQSFADAEIPISSMNVYRHDYLNYETHLTPDEIEYEFSYKFSYGFSITSPEAATEEQLTTLENSLENADYPMSINTWANDNDPFTTRDDPEVKENGYFMLEENTGSVSSLNSEAIMTYSNTYVSKQFFNAIIFTVIIVFFLIFIFFRWNIALGIFLSTFFESSLLFALFVVLWIPFGISFFIALASYVFLSILSKLLIIQKPTRDLIKTKSLDFENFKKDLEKSNKKYASLNFYIFFGFFICGILISTLAAASYLSFFAFALFALFISFFFNHYFFYHQTLKLTELRLKLKIRDQQKRIMKKEKEKNEEEYIEGVNC